MAIFEEQYLSNPNDNSQADWCAWNTEGQAFLWTNFYVKIWSFRMLPSIWIFRLGRWTGLRTLNFATTFLSIHHDYRHKWYSIWKPVDRAFRHVKYRGKTRPGCWVMNSWVSHWKQTWGPERNLWRSKYLLPSYLRQYTLKLHENTTMIKPIWWRTHLHP